MSDVFIFNFGLGESQYRSIIERLDTMSDQGDQIKAALADEQASIDALTASNAALVSLTNQIFTLLQNASGTGNGLTADELSAIVADIGTKKAAIDALKSTDDTTVTADTPPAP